MVPLTVPDIESPIDLLADWLELRALFSADQRAFVRELCAQADIAWDKDAIEIDGDDARLEDLAARLAEEVRRRGSILGSAYPFSMSHDGDTLVLTPESSWSVGEATYLFSLILAHATQSEIVSGKVAPSKPDLVRARDLFQICATLAAASHCEGPAFAFGFPRPDSSAFLSKVKQIWSLFKDGVPHTAPLPDSPTAVKDEGIDVIAWRRQADGKPSTLYLLAQVASGNDWTEKSVKTFIDLFHGEWFSTPPAAQAQAAIMIPFFVEGGEMRRRTRTHGVVFDRGRMPLLAGKAVNLVTNAGLAPVERMDETDKLKEWVLQHRTRVIQECSA
jgi:hypothetical protein